MKPNITIYSAGGSGETKKLDGFIAAAFWIGVDYAEHDLGSVKVRLPSESYDSDVSNLMEFTGLLVQRQVNFSVEFFTEPPPRDSAVPVSEEEANPDDATPNPVREGDLDFERELEKIKEEYQKGGVSKKQYDSKRSLLLKRWKEKVDGRLES